MSLETVNAIIRAIGLVAIYGITGFGPGIVIGVILGNLTAGRGFEPLKHQHDRKKKTAAEHNAQWHPSHKRWNG